MQFLYCKNNIVNIIRLIVFMFTKSLNYICTLLIVCNECYLGMYNVLETAHLNNNV